MRRPARAAVPLRDVFDRLLTDRWFFGDGDGELGISPSLDVRETADAYIVEADLPGVKPEDVEVTVEGRMLTMRGRMGADREERGEGYLVRERSSGSFTRTINLPGMFDPDKVMSEYADGELRITLPKAAASRARRIDVKTHQMLEGSATAKQ
jgi:HSP20 family protein